MTKRYLFLMILLVFGRCLLAQPTDLQLKEVNVLKDSVIDFTVDNLGNVYLLKPGQQVKKLDNHYDSIAVFNDIRRYGKLYAIDASNPLKVLLFYKDFNTVLALDRFLNIRNTIDLRQSNIFQAGAIATSFDNNVWVYDEMESKIKKVDDNGKVLLEAPDFRVLYDDPPRPTILLDYNKFLYAYDSSKGILVLDYFGANKNLVAFKGWRQLMPMAKGLVAVDNKGLLFYQPGQLDTESQQLPPFILQSQKLMLYTDRLYVLQADKKIHIYQIVQ